MLFSFLKQKLKFLVWHGFHAHQLHSAIDEWIVNPLITTQNMMGHQDLFQRIAFRYNLARWMDGRPLASQQFAEKLSDTRPSVHYTKESQRPGLCFPSFSGINIENFATKFNYFTPVIAKIHETDSRQTHFKKHLFHSLSLQINPTSPNPISLR